MNKMDNKTQNRLESSTQQIMEQMATYIQQLTPKETKAYEIAKSHLDTSFDLEKSRGFQTFIQQKEHS